MATPKSGGPTALRPGRRRPRATPTSPWQPPARTKSPLLALDAHRQNNRCETVLPQSLLPPIVVGSSESERQAFLESGNLPAWTLDTEPYQCRSPNQIRECRSPERGRVGVGVPLSGGGNRSSLRRESFTQPPEPPPAAP